MYRFTLRQLEYLVTCIDCRSVAGAAERLHVSQPTISVAITKLEDQLGVQLLLRHASRGVTATAGGLVFMGEGSGWIGAYDTTTGKRLWRYRASAGEPRATKSLANLPDFR